MRCYAKSAAIALGECRPRFRQFIGSHGVICQDRNGNDPVTRVVRGCRRRWRYWYLLLHLLMRSSLMEVHTINASRNKSTASHARTGNNDLCVLASHSQESFTDGIRSRCQVESFAAPDATRGSHALKLTLMRGQYRFHRHISEERAEEPFF